MRIEGSTLGIGSVVAVTSTVVAVVVWALIFFAQKEPTERRFEKIESNQERTHSAISDMRNDVSYIRGVLERDVGRKKTN